MSSGSQFAKSVLIQLAAFAWVVALASLVVLQQQGALSTSSVRFFTIVLVVVGIAAPFAGIGVFLYKRSKIDRDLIVNGLCPKCAYNLKGQPDWDRATEFIQCPECGLRCRVRGLGRGAS